MFQTIDKSVTLAWSNEHSPLYLATGKLAGTLSEDFDTTGELEIYSFNDASYKMEPVSKISTEEKFCRLSWSQNGDFIAGGMDNGLLSVWKFEDLINNVSATVHNTGIHEGAVKGLDFNHQQPNLLVSGGGKGKIYVWDLANDAKKYNISDKNPAGEANITCTKWNKLTAPVLASSSDNGTVALWDLRKNKSIHHFKEANTLYNSIAWSPISQTILATASETDGNAVIKIWDLKIAKKPLAILEGHNEGVLSLSWSSSEPNLLLSGGMDEMVYCWDIDSATAISEVTTTQSWISSVQWAPRESMLSVCSNDVQLITIPDFEQPIVKGGIMQPPKWLVPRAGVSFGFGGQIAFFGGDSNVKLTTFSEGAELAERASKLADALSDDADLSSYCNEKYDCSNDDNSKDLWKYLNIIGSSQDPRSDVISQLGFNIQEIKDNASNLLEKFQGEEKDEDKSSEIEDPSAASGLFTTKSEDFVDFPVAPVLDNTETTFAPNDSPILFDTNDFTLEELLTKHLIIGDFPRAVDLCFEANKPAEALILASKGGKQLLYNTQKRYLRSLETNFSNILEIVVDADWENLISRTDIKFWKELLAFCCTYADAPFQDLCNQIGDRLVKEVSDLENAVLCYICGCNLDGAIDIWNTVNIDPIEIIERVIVWSKIIGSRAPSSLVTLLGNTGETLANNGHLKVSLKLLTITEEIESSQMELLNRIQNSLGVSATSKKEPASTLDGTGRPPIVKTKTKKNGPKSKTLSHLPVPSPTKGSPVPVTFVPPVNDHPTIPHSTNRVPPSSYAPPPSTFVPNYAAPKKHIDTAPPMTTAPPKSKSKSRKQRTYIPPTTAPVVHQPVQIQQQTTMNPPSVQSQKVQEFAPPPKNATAPKSRRHQ